MNKNRLREKAIGWTNEQRKSRLHHIAINSRFLILPECEGTPNLASKVLSLVAERIPKDWLKKYGTPLLALETYVDPERNDNSGTCYIAAGWKNLGLSTGFQKKGEERTHSKHYLLFPLHKNSFTALSADIPHALLTGVKPVTGESNNNFVFDAGKIDLKELQHYLQSVPDPRRAHGLRYPFLPFLSLCIAATLSGYSQYRQIADWIRQLPGALRVSFGMPGDCSPNESTIGKLFSRIDETKLQAALNKWLTAQNQSETKTLSLDGKAIRGTSKDRSTQSKFLNLFATEQGIVIDQLPTGPGAAEKATARKIIQNNDIAGKTIVADALHTDKELIGEIEKKRLRISSLSKIISHG